MTIRHFVDITLTQAIDKTAERPLYLANSNYFNRR